MKCLIHALLLWLPLGLSAQITLTQTHVPAPGDTLFYARDTTITGFTPGPAGADQIWDFSQLQAEESFQLIAVDAAQDTESINYPGANLVIISDQVKTFIESSDTAVYILGGGIPEAAAFGLEVVRFEPPQKLYQLPTTFGTSFTNFYQVDVTVDGSLFITGADSIRVIRRATATAEVDGYGTVRTPFNSYPALRQKTQTVNYDSLYIKYFGLWLPLAADTSTSLQYQWLAAEAKGNVVTVIIDPLTGAIDNVEFFLDVENAAAPAAAFTYEALSGGTIAFTDQSGNNPSSWAWTFGDGGSSEEQDPVYTYTVAGTYQVCLTATNVFGSNQSCQNINVELVSGTLEPANRIATRVFPNPAAQWVHIQPDAWPSTAFSFRLFNAQGQQILQRRFSGRLELEVRDLPPGVYYFLLSSEAELHWSSGKLHISR